jgi:hypothetical protein
MFAGETLRDGDTLYYFGRGPSLADGTPELNPAQLERRCVRLGGPFLENR